MLEQPASNPVLYAHEKTELFGCLSTLYCEGVVAMRETPSNPCSRDLRDSSWFALVAVTAAGLAKTSRERQAALRRLRRRLARCAAALRTLRLSGELDARTALAAGLVAARAETLIDSFAPTVVDQKSASAAATNAPAAVQVRPAELHDVSSDAEIVPAREPSQLGREPDAAIGEADDRAADESPPDPVASSARAATNGGRIAPPLPAPH